MKTHISEFCTEFSEALFPLAEALGDTVHLIEQLGGESTSGMAESFANVKHRLEALVNKVQGQEAYVLLFGPLKSGKSTLINAISAGYVSEVTSLPAYPCMVYLKYGPQPSYSVIHYSGKREFFDSPQALKNLLEQSHRTLSRRIRAIDDFGETFDPVVHMPSAIRRVHVELPVENLRESGTVLVDTPGLYSKMKFGYDDMTQEFRDSAACAVFIVKTDNLFLEQVFTDFNDLLDQFSRVFVVVNIDTGKSDLCPDGTLAPSLESRDPDQIVKAFEMLTMSAPLRRAAENGRLHIYPIDLRGAAARRLQLHAQPGEPDYEEPDRFDDFLNDLMAYLNSTDYLLEFMADTIRQSGKLSDKITRLCQSDAVESIQGKRQSLEGELTTLTEKAIAANRALKLAWPSLLQQTVDREQTQRGAKANEVETAFAKDASALTQAWFESDQSINSLCENLGKRAKESLAAYVSDTKDGFVSVSGSAFGGAELDANMASDLNDIGLEFAKIVHEVSAVLSLPALEGNDLKPNLSDLPVRRSLADKLLFRSEDSIRRKFVESADGEIPAKLKQRKFADEAADIVCKKASRLLHGALNQIESEGCQPAMQTYVEGLADQAGKQIVAIVRELEKRQAAVSATIANLNKLAAQVETLAGFSGQIGEEICRLEEKHQSTVKNLQLGRTRETELPPAAGAELMENHSPAEQKEEMVC